jgi:AraC-like DNA-binding protein
MSISSTLVDSADIQFHAAVPALKPYVGCFWVITAEHGATMRVVPDGTTTVAVLQQQDGRFDAYLRGPFLHPVELEIKASTTLIGVRLRPGVAFSLTGVTAHSMVNRRTSLTDYDTLREFASIDPVPKTATEWIESLQQLLIDRLAETSINPVVAKALDEIHAEHGRVSVADVASRCGVSERHLCRLMRDWAGYGTKQYASVVRFQSTLAQMERAPNSTAAVLAADTGYFDQSHLNVDVARYAGDTPGSLVSERVSDFSKTHCDVPY